MSQQPCQKQTNRAPVGVFTTEALAAKCGGPPRELLEKALMPVADGGAQELIRPPLPLRYAPPECDGFALFDPAR